MPHGDQTVKLQYADGVVDLPTIEGTEGDVGVDIAGLRAKTGLVSLDNGFVNTASTKSAVTFIDGEAGILRYRGYPIEQLAQHSNYIETSYLLVHGELPTESELEEFTARIRRHTLLPEDLIAIFRAFPAAAHPMAMLSAAVSALQTYYPDSLDPLDPLQVERATVLLLAKFPTLAAYAYKRTKRQPLLYPENARGLVENFLRMSFGSPAEPYNPDPVLVDAMDMLFVLHADHEQNCSASTVRMVGSSHANLYAAISAGIQALSGPLHGGANQAVLEMLDNIQASEDGADSFMKRVKNKERGVRLMGFGHRVYKNYDPRAKIIKSVADQVILKLGGNDEQLEIAQRLEEIALNDQYFIDRKLYPNVDFYTGLIYKAMGFDPKMFTVLFAIGRLPGWIAQWREMIEDPETKINRPRQIYTGATERPYVPVAER